MAQQAQIKTSTLDKYEKLEELGKGTFAIVYKCQNKENGQIYAMKKIRIQSESEGVPSSAIREISLLRSLQETPHPNIVKLSEVVMNKGKLVLIFEYLEQDLYRFIQSHIINNQSLSINQVKSFVYQIVSGLMHCHSLKILHRDLKPQNLLLSKDGIIKIADFGLARSGGIPIKNQTHEVVTLWYRPPDVLMGSTTYTVSIDIWSLGCIMAELINLNPLFQGQNDKDQLIKIFKIMGTPDLSIWPEAEKLPLYKEYQNLKQKAIPLKDIVPDLDEKGIDFLSKCLQMNPLQRVSCKELICHPWLQDVPQQFKNLMDNQNNLKKK